MVLTLVAVKLVEGELQALDQLTDLKGYGTRSATLRAALGAMFDQYGLSRAAEQAIEKQRTRHLPRCRFRWGKLPGVTASVFDNLPVKPKTGKKGRKK